MNPEPAPKTGYRWLKAEHPDLGFWGIPSPMPWPAEEKGKIDTKDHFPFARLLVGIQRLRADGKQWKDEWGKVETFLQRGDALNALLEAGDIEAVVVMLTELEALRPGTAYCAFNTAFALSVLGDAGGALAAAIKATERAPKIENLWMRRGDMHEKQGQDKDAIFCFRKALALLPNHQQATEGLARLGALTKLTMQFPDGTHRDQYFTHAEFAGYVRENTAKSAPEDPMLRVMEKQFRESGNGEGALVTVDRILSGSPPDALLLKAHRADALRLLKRMDEAEAQIARILEEDPRHAQALYVRAWCEFDTGRNEEGWESINEALWSDPNHEKAVGVRFQVGAQNTRPELIAELCAWARVRGSWRGYWWASVHASTIGNEAAALQCAEAAYKLAPQERDVLFFYANCLNNMNEGEHTAALIHPRLPEVKGDFTLKYIFAGAMKKLGLPEEAIRVLREALAEQSDATVEWRGWGQHFLDELLGLIAQGDIDPELHPHTGTLRRSLWIGDDQGPQTEFLPSGMVIPMERPVKMEPPPGFAGSTGSVALYQHGTNAEMEPVSLGWFRAHEIDFSETERPMMIIRVTEKKKLEATVRQGTRRLPVTWSLYRVPSMETERAPE